MGGKRQKWRITHTPRVTCENWQMQMQFDFDFIHFVHIKWNSLTMMRKGLRINVEKFLTAFQLSVSVCGNFN